jgi:peroxiredoxin
VSRPPFRAPLAPGDIAPEGSLRALDGETVELRGDAIAGHLVVLLFCPKFAAAGELLDAVRTRLSAFAASAVKLFALTLEPAKIAAEQKLPFPVLLDREGDAFHSFGVPSRDLPSIVVLRANHHVAAVLKPATPAQVEEVLALTERLAAERRPAALAAHPPVLIVPEVLSAEDCRRLIRVYETRGNVFVEPGHGDDHMASDYKMRIPEYGRGDRIDHWVIDRDTNAFIDGRLQARLFPEIRRAFQYRVTRRERMRIGCYTGARGGELHGHRDDSEPISAHRRFATSINLNTEEFAGGELRFPEFGDQRYRPESGAAIVFSCSLLHEALEVTAGTRLVLLAFLFGEH